MYLLFFCCYEKTPSPKAAYEKKYSLWFIISKELEFIIVRRHHSEQQALAQDQAGENSYCEAQAVNRDRKLEAGRV